MNGEIKLRPFNYGRDDDLKSKKQSETEIALKGSFDVKTDGSIAFTDQNANTTKKTAFASGEVPKLGEAEVDEECLFIPAANLLNVCLKDDDKLVRM